MNTQKIKKTIKEEAMYYLESPTGNPTEEILEYIRGELYKYEQFEPETFNEFKEKYPFLKCNVRIIPDGNMLMLTRYASLIAINDLDSVDSLRESAKILLKSLINKVQEDLEALSL